MKLVTIFLIKSIIEIFTSSTPIDYSEKDWPEACSSGLKNSPIDFPPLTASNYIVTNDYINILSNTYIPIQGKSFKQENWKYYVDMKDLGTLMIKKNGIVYSYNLIDLHFHISSSHTFQGSSYDLEFHLVHQKDTQYLIDQGVLNDTDKNNSMLIIAVLFKVSGETLNLDIQKMNMGTLAPINEIDLSPYVSVDRNFYHYEGSRTSPLCEEIVNWIVMEDIETLSATQYDDFRNWVFQTYPSGNTRLTKPLFGRSIYLVKNSSQVLTTTFILVLNLFLLL